MVVWGSDFHLEAPEPRLSCAECKPGSAPKVALVTSNLGRQGPGLRDLRRTRFHEGFLRDSFRSAFGHPWRASTIHCSASVPRAVFPFGWRFLPIIPPAIANRNIVGLRGAAGKATPASVCRRGIWLKEVVLSFMVFARIDPVRVPMPSGRPWSSS